MGVAHHAAFVPWLEMARTELLRSCGVTYAQLEGAGVFLVVAKLDVRYRRPARYDDLLEVRTRVTGASRVKLMHDYEVRLLERTGTDAVTPPPHAEGVLVVASTTLACVDRDGRPRPLPDWLSGAE
jgi:acyl-CoA thioester hydrolase